MAAAGFRELFHLTASLTDLHFAGRMAAQLCAQQFDFLLQQRILFEQFVARSGKQVVFAFRFHDPQRLFALEG